MSASPRSESTASGAAFDRLASVLVGGFLAILGGVVAQRYQADYAKEQFGIQLRLKEQEDATAALKEVGALADAPTSRALSLVEATLEGRPDTTLRRLGARFDEAVDAWHLGYNRASVLAWVYFKDTAFVAEVDSMVAYTSRQLPPALGRRRAVDVARYRAEAESLRAKGDSRASELLRIANEMGRKANELVRLDREVAELLRAKLRADQRLVFDYQMLWASLISTRQAGSFDPLARYTLTPAEEARAVGILRKRVSLDSIAALKAEARPDTR